MFVAYFIDWRKKMSEAKFTKREWVVVTEPESEHYLLTVDCGGIMQVNVITSATDVTFSESIERSANAHLIAAAPEMYEMLEKIHDSMAGNGEYGEFYHDVKELLAKARGES